ncbi:MAG: hypothetical protein ACRELW_22510 [Candidatus Rokuibacteriota bacterium]
MRVLVVFIVSMKVIMFQQLVKMLVLVALRDVKPYAGQHERSTCRELYGKWLAEGHHRPYRPSERRDGKVGSGARCAEIP